MPAEWVSITYRLIFAFITSRWQAMRTFLKDGIPDFWNGVVDLYQWSLIRLLRSMDNPPDRSLTVRGLVPCVENILRRKIFINRDASWNEKKHPGFY
ncbi:MAG: hypothetical protein R6T99_11410 [Bacteroidales bacterium]